MKPENTVKLIVILAFLLVFGCIFLLGWSYIDANDPCLEFNLTGC